MKGLQYLHENGLLHRDIKAANLLLDCGTVVLADFGVSNHLLASTTSERGKTSLRRRRSFLGTPFFMAPEILQHHEYNQNVDIWALGISTLELATGWPPLCDHDAATVRYYSISFALFLKSLINYTPITHPTSSDNSNNPLIENLIFISHDYLNRYFLMLFMTRLQYWNLMVIPQHAMTSLLAV